MEEERRPHLLHHAHQELVHVVLDATGRLDELTVMAPGQGLALWGERQTTVTGRHVLQGQTLPDPH